MGEGLPSGTVTMLFSDIEGSTSMLQRLGSHWGEALSDQRSILRSAFADHDGHEMGTEGDSFFVVFPRAQQALAAAVDGQRRLAHHHWPDGVELRVRMGLHTGEPQRHEEGYIGLDVHRAARIAATAAGGQVVLSATTCVLVSEQEIGVGVRDLGHHRLKDLDEPEQLFDLVGPGLPDGFPPVRGLGALASLPTYTTELVGRGAELRAVCEDFEQGARLVSLTGPGGSGKTRLAVSIAADMQCRRPRETYFVALHTADHAALMWSAVAEAVGVPADVDVLPRDRVLGWLAGRPAFLVLDNLEQIPEADVVVTELLGHAGDVVVLATSRRPLHLVDERIHPVEPLPVPATGVADLESVASSEAVTLFCQRARMVQPRFALTPDNVADVVDLCRRLDGLPLAIELTAARARLLSPRAMLRRIEEHETNLYGATDRVERQQTLAATVAWSHDLLTETDRQVFRRLGVFADRVDLQAVESVVGAGLDHDPFDTVAHLVDVNLLDVAEGADGEPRISMLVTIRRFAAQQLRCSGEGEETRLRHALWCADRAAEIVAVLHSASQMKALDRMDAVEQDVRAALEWCLVPGSEGSPQRREAGYRLLREMSTYWYRFGYVAEGTFWHERALEIMASDHSEDNATLADALHGAGVHLLQRSDLDAGRRVLGRALELARNLGDLDREARECNSLGIALRAQGDPVGARELIERSVALARRTGNRQREATALGNVTHVLMDVGEYAAAVAAGRAAVAADRALGDPWGTAISQCNLAFALLNAEGPDAAYDHLCRVAPEAVALADVELSIEVIEMFATVWAELGDAGRAALLEGVGDAQRDTAGLPRALPDEEHLQRHLGKIRGSIPSEEWLRHHRAGSLLDIDAALSAALARQEVAHE